MNDCPGQVSHSLPERISLNSAKMGWEIKYSLGQSKE